MKNLLLGSLLVILSLSFTSCLEIIEKVKLNQNGSGTYALTIDMEDMMNMMEAFMPDSLKQENNIDLKMDSIFDETSQKYANIAGINNVEQLEEGYQYTIKFDFKNIDALNEALNAKEENKEYQEFFNWKKGTLTRANNMSIDQANLSLDDESSNSGMAKMMMRDMKYTTIYELPGKVKKMTNKDATLSSDNQTVTVSASILDMMDKKTKIDNTIKYKK